MNAATGHTSKSRAITAADRGRLLAVFARTANPVVVTDDDRRFVDANLAATRLYRIPRETLLGLRVEDVTPPEQRGHIGPWWAAFMSAGATVGRWQLLRGDGTTTWTDFNATAAVLPQRHLFIVVLPPSFVATSGHTTPTVIAPQPGAGAPNGRLTKRERQVIELLAHGATTDEVADDLGISTQTVRVHARNVTTKLGARTRAHAVGIAVASHACTPPIAGEGLVPLALR